MEEPTTRGSPITRCLVTGGFGFVGSHLVELLLEGPGTSVHVLDDQRSSPLPLDRLLSELPSRDRLTYDLRDLELDCRTNGHQTYDEIYHLASPVGPVGVLPHAGQIAKSIIDDAVIIARRALACGAKLIYVSSSEVYGGGEEGLCSESMPCLMPLKASPRSEYALGKLAAETALLNLSVAHSLDVRIVRPFNVTGPRQSGRGGFVLPRFIGQALARKPITVFGTGTQKRAFAHVRDIVVGIQSAARRGAKGGIYNIGNPANLCTVRELATEVRDITHSPSEIILVDPKQLYGPLYAEADDKYPDLSKSQAELGWTPRLTRRQAIEDTYRYMSTVPEPILAGLRGF